MTEIKLRKIRSLVLVALVMLLPLVSGSPTSAPALAAPAEMVTLGAIQDSYADLNLSTTNFNEGLLNLANSPGAPGESDLTTKYIYLKFDLSGVDFEIRSASLSLSTLTCEGLVPVDEVEIDVFGVGNGAGWSESSLTWNNQPPISTSVLASLDAGSTTADVAQTYTWTDNNRGDLVTWLDSQRSTNDGSATLVLVIDKADDPGIADIFFEDREGSGAAYGCADSLGGPTLEVSSFIGGRAIFLPLITR